MKFKQYLEYVSTHVPADSEKPTDIVQALACLIATRLSVGGKLPIACGSGNDLDMDIVQAGLLAGLAKLREHKPELGTMRQFLYPTMAGAMANYAWERENRVADSRPAVPPQSVSFSEHHDSEKDVAEFTEDSKENTRTALVERALIEPNTPETLMEEEEEAQRRRRAVKTAIKGLGQEATLMLMRDAQIGYNAAKRAEWAAEIGVSVGALSVRLSRLRRDARDWALTVQ